MQRYPGRVPKQLRFMKYLRAVGVFVGVAALLLGISFSSPALRPLSWQSDDAIARAQVLLCSDKTDEEQKEICYQKNIPTLIGSGLSMERTFGVVRRVLALDRGYKSCHVLAHLIASREVARDPAAWKDVIVRSPMDICESGAAHGAFQERFSTESMPDATTDELVALLDGVCDARAGWSPTFLARSSCLHGLGHLFLYVTAADVQKSVALCGILGKRPDFDFSYTCTEGVFMQLYQPLGPEDENLIHAIKDAAWDTRTFCAQFKGLAYNACVKEGWPAVKDSTTDPKVFERLCRQIPDTGESLYCAKGLMYPVVGALHYDVKKIEAFCNALSSLDLRNICWARTASKFIWTDSTNAGDTLAVCYAAPQESQGACWGELINHAEVGMEKDSPDTRALCSGMPEPYRSTCITGTTGTI